MAIRNVSWLPLYALLAGCASMSTFEVNQADIFYVADYEVDTAQHCTVEDVNLDHKRATEFFHRARQVEPHVINNFYPVAPCWAAGLVKYKTQNCSWEVSAAGTGWIACDDEHAKRWYFACDDCDDLLTHAGP